MSSLRRSAELRQRALTLLPGGVSSPVRAYAAVGGEAPVIASAKGARLVDVDGNEYIDFVLAYGPLILGHGHPAVVEAVARQLEKGTAYGATSEGEIELAQRISSALPTVEMLRFVNSGTEATMSAIRLARAVTGRDVIIKCAGGYHGHADALLAEAGSGVATLGIAASPGVPAAAVADTAVVPYNDDAAVARVMDERRVACVIVEPVAGNMGCVAPRAGYLESLRQLCTAHGALLIFDEVMTGFRVAWGGAQLRYGVKPDLTCLGKIIGGGLPVGAYGGSSIFMNEVAPAGPVYQAGTLSGNPLAMAAGIATLDVLSETQPYARLEALGARLAAGLRGALHPDVVVNQVGSMLTPFLTSDVVVDYSSAARSSRSNFAELHHAFTRSGIFWPPSQFEAAFLSSAHTEADVDAAVVAASLAMAPIASALH